MLKKILLITFSLFLFSCSKTTISTQSVVSTNVDNSYNEYLNILFKENYTIEDQSNFKTVFLSYYRKKLKFMN
jgi:hypothetical protein